MDTPFEVFFTNLWKYNEGRLVGEDLKFPTTTKEVQTLDVALDAGLGVWGVVNLLEEYGFDNPGANAHASAMVFIINRIKLAN